MKQLKRDVNRYRPVNRWGRDKGSVQTKKLFTQRHFLLNETVTCTKGMLWRRSLSYTITDSAVKVLTKIRPQLLIAHMLAKDRNKCATASYRIQVTLRRAFDPSRAVNKGKGPLVNISRDTI